MAILISESKDGDFIAQVVHRFGNCSVRGSSSKGGSRALKALITHLKKIFLRRLPPMVLEARH
ncbi:PF04028 domain protein [Leptospira borgpetersenii str. 200701203]|uniref:PF04028 domain protein n=1 Tax=Leptospira borgpetersenii str. 200701203 TaxID=1193007 RepID=M3HT80_LEPBO|nr:PF04028 domain protein [Leptospira borgpetersenii str. 200701203]